MLPVLKRKWKDILKPGSSIICGTGAAYPKDLIHQLLENHDNLPDIDLVVGPNEVATLPQTLERVHLKQLGSSANSDSQIDTYPWPIDEIPMRLVNKSIRCDVAIVMVSPCDARGYYSLGTSNLWERSICQRAETIIVQINSNLPFTHGDTFIHESEIDFFYEKKSPLTELKSTKFTEIDLKIAKLTAKLVDDGDCLRLGHGCLYEALAECLSDRKHLGYHGLSISNAVFQLIKKGVIDNSKKLYHPGKSTASHIYGNKALYDFCDNNPHINLINAAEAITNINTAQRNIAIFSAESLSLNGEINLTDNDHFWLEYTRKAGIKIIIMLPSLDSGKRKKSSSIYVSQSPNKAIPADYVISEYGIANLKGTSLYERVASVIEVAHPQFREKLLKEARKASLLPEWFSISTAENSPNPEFPKLIYFNKKRYFMRFLSSADFERLREFFYSHSTETLQERYGFGVHRMSPQQAHKKASFNIKTEWAIGLLSLNKNHSRIDSLLCCYVDKSRKSAEVSFVTRENYRRMGMAKALLEEAIHFATNTGLDYLWAQIERDNVAMLRLFHQFDVEAFEEAEGPVIKLLLPLKKT